jgi:NADPH:quinone reductase-like Zn-dependent oxidoreductase
MPEPGAGQVRIWVKAAGVSPTDPKIRRGDAAALPASAEAAVGILKQLGAAKGETLLVLGAAGSVGMIATQLAVSRGATVVGAGSPRDHDLVRDLGGVPVSYGAGLADRVREISPSVGAVGKGQLPDVITLAGGPARVMTLADEHAADLGVALSVPTPDRAPEAVDQTMPLLASGALRLRRQRQLPMAAAAEAHRLLENGEAAEKLVLRSAVNAQGTGPTSPRSATDA